MPVTKDDFITIGTINSDKSTEIELRCAIRCLYYGVYHQARALSNDFPDHSKGSPRKGLHDQLVGYFSDFPISGTPIPKDIAFNLRSLGHLLRELKSKRTIADYELCQGITNIDYKLHFEHTNNALALCETLTKKCAALP